MRGRSTHAPGRRRHEHRGAARGAGPRRGRDARRLPRRRRRTAPRPPSVGRPLGSVETRVDQIEKQVDHDGTRWGSRGRWHDQRRRWGRAGSGEGRGLVLVVEDDRAIADLVGLYLRRDGFGVHVERDGQAGLAAVRRLRPAAVVLDVGLPGHGRHRGLPTAARRGRLDAGAVRHRPRRRGRPRARPGDGRRRLRHQAVQPARARGAGADRAAPLRARRRAGGGVGGGRGAHRGRPPPRPRGGRRGRADLHRVRPARPPHARPRPGVHPRAAAVGGVGVRGVGGHPHRRRARGPAARQARRRPARSAPCAGVGYAADRP